MRIYNCNYQLIIHFSSRRHPRIVVIFGVVDGGWFSLLSSWKLLSLMSLRLFWRRIALKLNYYQIVVANILNLVRYPFCADSWRFCFIDRPFGRPRDRPCNDNCLLLTMVVFVAWSCTFFGCNWRGSQTGSIGFARLVIIMMVSPGDLIEIVDEEFCLMIRLENRVSRCLSAIISD
jgi:hypothetical protein